MGHWGLGFGIFLGFWAWVLGFRHGRRIQCRPLGEAVLKILVVEDEKKLAGFVQRALSEEGHVVEVCHDGKEGELLALSGDHDVVLLDLNLPNRDGMSILREMRGDGLMTPVLILTARDTVKDRVAGLDEGADDYLTKPFSLSELQARIRALFRRGSTRAITELAFADLSVDLVGRSVTRGERKIDLTPREFSLLEYLLRNADRVVTRSAIAEHVWDFNFEWNSNVVDVYINALRKKLESGGEARLIQTVRGVGYSLRSADAS